jgi:hypothetical protein
MVYLFFDSLSISVTHAIRRIHAFILPGADTPRPFFNLSVNLQSCHAKRNSAQKQAHPQNVSNHGALIPNASINFASAIDVLW